MRVVRASLRASSAHQSFVPQFLTTQMATAREYPRKMRNCCFTEFRDVDAATYFDGVEGLRYGIVGRETCPDTGRAHLQGYMEFTAPRPLAWIKRAFNNDALHCESRKGTAAQAADYCKKDGDFVEVGVMSVPAGARTDLDEVKALIREGKTDLEVADAHFADWCRYGKAFTAYRGLLQPKRNWKTEVHILWGEAGCGKTRFAMEQGATPIQFVNGFFLGYENQESVIFDDFSSLDIPMLLMLQLCDRYPMKVNVKGGSVEWNPRVIYITTNKDPVSFYGGKAQWIRRVTSTRKLGDEAFVGDALLCEGERTSSMVASAERVAAASVDFVSPAPIVAAPSWVSMWGHGSNAPAVASSARPCSPIPAPLWSPRMVDEMDALTSIDMSDDEF